MNVMNLFTPQVGAKHELLFNKPVSALHSNTTRVEVASVTNTTAYNQGILKGELSLYH